jgi:sortase A
VGIALVALSGLALGQGAWMIGSARLGEAVAERAWTQARGQANGAEPRLAAGGSAVARLRVPALGIDEIVVAGEEAELERGPRLVAGSLAAGVGGHAVVAGHRDLHFRFLRDLRPGDELLLASPDGWQRRYRVVGVEVLEGADPRLAETGSAPALTLLTHYPFDAVPPGGPLRYAVHAVASGG